MPRRKDENSPYRRQMRQAEKRMIEYAIQCGGSLRQAAVLLGVSESFLIGRAGKLGCNRVVKKPRVRGPDKGPRRRPERTPSNVIQLDAGRENEHPDSLDLGDDPAGNEPLDGEMELDEDEDGDEGDGFDEETDEEEDEDDEPMSAGNGQPTDGS